MTIVFKVLSLKLTLLLLIVISESIILKKAIGLRGGELNSNCEYWINTLQIVNIMFCDAEAEDFATKIMLKKETTFTTSTPDKTTTPTFYKELNVYPDFLIFLNSANLEKRKLEKCIMKAIPSTLLSVKTKIVFCDCSTVLPKTIIEDGVNLIKILGHSNILYITERECWYASPNYLIQRSFHRTKDCDRAPWVFREKFAPDMQGQKLKVYVFDRLLSAIIHRNESIPERRYDGVEVNIFFEAGKKLNFTWEFDEITDKNKWGELINGTWKGGVMEQLTSGDGDFSPTTFWLLPNILEYVDYTFPWIKLNLLFLVPRPTLIGGNMRTLFKPLNPHVWEALIATLVALPLIAWLLANFYQRFLQHQHRPRTLTEYFLYQVGSLTGNSGELGSRRESSALRWMYSWWYVFVLLLITCFNSKIVSNITRPSFTPKIDTVKQLVEQNFSWGRPYFIPDPSKFLDPDQNHWHKQFVKNYITYNISEERNLVLSRKFALYVQALSNSKNILVDNPLDDDVASTLRVMKEVLRSYPCSSSFRKNSPVTLYYDKIIIRMLETGIIQAYKRRAMLKYLKLSYFEILDETNINLSPNLEVLNLEMLKYIFFMLVIGLILSFACFILEMSLRNIY